MALPHKLKDFNLFVDGNSWQGITEEIELPELTRAVEEYRGAGMDGPVELDLGQEAIEMTVTPGGIQADYFAHYGAATHDAMQLRWLGSYESDETGQGKAVEIVVRGRVKGLALGTAKNGDNNTPELTLALSYYKLTIDGADMLEIDQPGLVFRVMGRDRYAERRRRLGLASALG